MRPVRAYLNKVRTRLPRNMTVVCEGEVNVVPPDADLDIDDIPDEFTQGCTTKAWLAGRAGNEFQASGDSTFKPAI